MDGRDAPRQTIWRGHSRSGSGCRFCCSFASWERGSWDTSTLRVCHSTASSIALFRWNRFDRTLMPGGYEAAAAVSCRCAHQKSARRRFFDELRHLAPHQLGSQATHRRVTDAGVRSNTQARTALARPHRQNANTKLLPRTRNGAQA